MRNVPDSATRAARIAQREERARAGNVAMQEYEAKKAAQVAKTERLRALRLAKEAAEPPAVVPIRKRSASASA
jgi:hypothetical protein